MDSINQQQPEDIREDLRGLKAGQKIKKLAEEANSCFFCTDLGNAEGFSTRPMSAQMVDEDGVCWFLSASDSHKNAHIQANPRVQLLFQASKHSGFLCIQGDATISRDKDKIKELWEPIIKTWFTGGVDDPRITVLRVSPANAYYWDTKHGETIAFLKQMAGAVIGKTLDDSVEGTLKP